VSFSIGRAGFVCFNIPTGHAMNVSVRAALAAAISGNVYIALGDGGGEDDHDCGSTSSDSDDGHTSTSGNGQDTNVVYGKILRINPLDPDGAGPQSYSVPASNPFVGAPGLDEIYAYGLRNPFQIHFDRGTGTLYAGDVGQAQRQEIDIITPGGNYGG
jgi:glucose/arabinose dehydrogenase